MAHQIGQSGTAVELIEKAIKVNPNEADFYNNCGEAYLALQNYELAVSRYEQALAIKPDFAGAHNNLGNAYKEMGRLEDAISRYNEAIALSPEFPMAHNNLGIILSKLNRAEDAIESYKRALAIFPGYAEAHNNLGNTFQELGRYTEAIKYYEEATSLVPDYAEGHRNLGNALKALGRRDEAIARYEKALFIKPDYAAAHLYLSMLSPRQENISVINSLLQKDALSEVDAAHYHFALGNIYHDEESFNKAFEHFEKASELKRLTINYNSGDYSSYVDRQALGYSADYFRELEPPALIRPYPFLLLVCHGLARRSLNRFFAVTLLFSVQVN